MYSIAIITPQTSLKQIMEIDDTMRKKAGITYLIYTSLEHLKVLYAENAEKYDAFIFSGFYPCDYLKSCALLNESKPFVHFDLTDRDYYKMLAKIAIQNPDIDFSRVSFELSSDYDIDFQSVFLGKKLPYLNEPMSLQDYYATLPNLYEIFFQNYLRLKEEQGINFVVTRLSSLIPRLEAKGIKCEHCAPSKESMCETFQELIARLNQDNVQAATTAFCMILPESEEFSDAEQLALSEALNQYNKIFGMNFIINHSREHFELTTDSSALKSITNHYTACPVTSYLHETLDFSVCVGWGCSSNVVIAYRNAWKAARESKLCTGHPAFAVVADNHIIGPLSSQRRIAYSDHPDERISAIARRVTLSPLCIRKIISVLNQKNSNSISSEELAYFLNLTIRSASRILSKLESGGAAQVTYNRQMNLRGRPAKIYQIDFSKI